MCVGVVVDAIVDAGRSDGWELVDGAVVMATVAAAELRKFELIVVSFWADSVDLRSHWLAAAHDDVDADVVRVLHGEMSFDGALLWRLFDKFVWWSIFFCCVYIIWRRKWDGGKNTIFHHFHRKVEKSESVFARVLVYATSILRVDNSSEVLTRRATNYPQHTA